MPSCRSLAGNAQDAVLWELDSFDIDRLRADLAKVIAGWDWSSGSFGHSLPLTTTRLCPQGASHYNNRIRHGKDAPLLDAPDRLDDCHYFRGIFDGFGCEKSSFRILRRPAQSSYTLHKDDDIEAGIQRFQVPIITNPDVLLLVSTIDDKSRFILPAEDYRKVENWNAHGISPAALRGWLDEFIRLNSDRVRIYQADAGKLYYFDTRNYHNVWNFGAEPRFTLSIDLVANDWLHDRWPEVFQRAH